MLSIYYALPLRFAHEVYVLDNNSIDSDRHNHSVNIWQALNGGKTWIIFFVFVLLIGCLFALALHLKSTPFFKKLGLKLDNASIFAPDLIRIAFGASLLFSASHAALYGPELPLHSLVGGKLIQAILWICGTALIIGFWNRLWATLAAIIWLWAFITKGVYLLTYLNYLGEAIAVFLLPCQRLSVDFLITSKKKSISIMKHAAYSMPAARILFGLSLLYTAITMKFMDTAISLDVVNHYHLTDYFPFPLLFVVLGAGLLELAVSLLYITGVLQRFTTIIFLTFMTLSLLFFKESVWPHYLLIAIAAGIFLHRPDVWTIDRYLFPTKKTKNLHGLDKLTTNSIKLK